jgi:long-chain acyl-CoA synthetase
MALEASGLDTFPKLLAHHAQQRASKPAVREKSRGIWRTTTWRELADDAQALATVLARQGLGKGGFVAVLGDNRPQLYAATCAAHLLGAVVVPLFPDATAAEIAPLLRSTGATLAFAENQEQVDKLLEVLPQCPALRWVVYDEDRGMRHYKQPQLASHAELLRQGREQAASQGAAVQAAAAKVVPADAAFLFFTSGTTGPSKGVLLSHAALIDRARTAVVADRLTDADLTLAYLPPAWIGQAFFGYAQPMVAGSCVCCPESSETLLADMREVGPTYLLVPPRALKAFRTQVTMRLHDASKLNRSLYERFIGVAERAGARILAGEPVPFGDRIAYALGDLTIFGPLRDVLGMSKLRVAYAAGDTIDGGLLMYFRSLGINLKPLYGSTETGFFVATQPDGAVRAEVVGAPTAGVELKLGPQREILVKSAGLLSAYHGGTPGPDAGLPADGWFRTGDAGELRADGQLRVLDRLAHIGALNDGTPVLPRVLESKLKLAPYIREAVVFGAGRDRVCALIDIDTAAVGQWADRADLSYTGHADLASMPQVQGLVADCIGALNTELAQDPALAGAQVHRFAVLRQELDPAEGLLTRTGQLRRDAIAARYAALVDAMYAGAAIAQDIAIGNAKVAPATTLRKAA